MCYLPNAKGGHAKHVETGQVTSPKVHSSKATEAMDYQSHSLRVRAEGDNQIRVQNCRLHWSQNLLLQRRASTRSPAPPGRASRGSSPAPPGELVLKPEPHELCKRAFRQPAASRAPLPCARALPPNTRAPRWGTAPCPLPPSAPEARRAVRKVALNSAALCQGTSSRSEGWEAAILTQGQPWGSNH